MSVRSVPVGTMNSKLSKSAVFEPQLENSTKLVPGRHSRQLPGSALESPILRKIPVDGFICRLQYGSGGESPGVSASQPRPRCKNGFPSFSF